MLVAGEEPLYLLRRLTRAAVEDIGLADPQALVQCLAAKDTYDFLGSPEGEIGDRPGLPLSRHRAQIERHLLGAEGGMAERQGDRLADAAEHILNAPTKLMKDLGYGKGYAYDHDRRRGLFRARTTGPTRWSAQAFYEPIDRGFEAQIAERLDFWNERRKALNNSGETQVKLRRTKRGAARCIRSTARLLASPAHLLGAQGPHRAAHPVATWIVARAVKWVIQKAIDRSPALRKHVTGTPEETVGHQLGVIAKLFIWLVGIMAALSFLGVGQILAPINELVDRDFRFPAAADRRRALFFIGLILARIVQPAGRNRLGRANVDGLLARIGIGETVGTRRTTRPPSRRSAAPARRAQPGQGGRRRSSSR